MYLLVWPRSDILYLLIHTYRAARIILLVTDYPSYIRIRITTYIFMDTYVKCFLFYFFFFLVAGWNIDFFKSNVIAIIRISNSICFPNKIMRKEIAMADLATTRPLYHSLTIQWLFAILLMRRYF